jgi:hypothetical protein
MRSAAFKQPKRPNQKLLAYLQADRQWPRMQRIRFAERCLKLAKAAKEDTTFWEAVLFANGVNTTARRVMPSTRWSMGDRSPRTGTAPALSYEEYLKQEGYKK